MGRLTTPNRGDKMVEGDVTSSVWMQFFEDITKQLNDINSTYNSELIKLSETVTDNLTIYTTPAHTKTIIRNCEATNNGTNLNVVNIYIVPFEGIPEDDNKLVEQIIEVDQLVDIREMNGEVLQTGDYIYIELFTTGDVLIDLTLEEII